MPVMDIKIIPMGTRTASVSEALLPAIRILEQDPDVRFQVTAMGTMVEGCSLARLYELAARMHQAVLDVAPRVVVFTEVDERQDKRLSIEGKVHSLEEKRHRRKAR